MEVLTNKIDFAGIISAQLCNPNGDPLNNNMPRTDWEGYGIISDVCLKRKIRDRLQDAGYNILNEKPENTSDGIYSIAEKVKTDLELKKFIKKGDSIGFKNAACSKWVDVRTFGQVFAYKDKDTGSVSIGVRGPVSIQFAKTIDVPPIDNISFTKAINSNQNDGSTFNNNKYLVSRGVYVFYGGIYPQLAAKTGFSENDAKALKDAIVNMFMNDASSSRPAGSMRMEKVYWWEHNNFNGQYSPSKVHKSLNIIATDTGPYFKVKLNSLPGLEPEIIEGW